MLLGCPQNDSKTRHLFPRTSSIVTNIGAFIVRIRGHIIINYGNDPPPPQKKNIYIYILY